MGGKEEGRVKGEGKVGAIERRGEEKGKVGEGERGKEKWVAIRGSECSE